MVKFMIFTTNNQISFMSLDKIRKSANCRRREKRRRKIYFSL